MAEGNQEGAVERPCKRLCIDDMCRGNRDDTLCGGSYCYRCDLLTCGGSTCDDCSNVEADDDEES